MTEIGIKIKRYRWARGWTQQKLATEAGLSMSVIAKLEAGREWPRIPTARALARALGVPLVKLIEDREDRRAA